MIRIQFKAPWRKDLVIHGFTSDQPSMTVPDESYSIRQLVGMFASQLPPDLANYSDYDGENPDFDDIDIVTQFGDLADYDAAKLDQLEKVVNAQKKQKELQEFIEHQQKSKKSDIQSDTMSADSHTSS